MDFFLTLSQVGSTVIVDIFNNIITFFNTPVRDLLGVSTVIVHGVSRPVLRGHGLLDIFYSVWDWIVPSGSNASVTSSLWTPLVGILDMIGLDTSLPMWSFMLSNISIIILSSIALRFLSVFK